MFRVFIYDNGIRRMKICDDVARNLAKENGQRAEVYSNENPSHPIMFYMLADGNGGFTWISAIPNTMGHQ